MAVQKKREQAYVDRRFGFEVILVDVPMKQVRGESVPDINANHLRTAVLAGLTTKPGPLSGVEVRFVRHWMEHTTTEFGELLGVTHAAVIKWEKKGPQSTGMNRATEFRLRLLILKRLPESVQMQLVDAQQEKQANDPELRHLFGLLEDLWREASTEIHGSEPIRIPPELIAQQSLRALRR